MTKFMSCLGAGVKAIKNGADLETMCRGIRTKMLKCNCRRNKATLDIGIRDRDLYNDGDIIGEMSSKGENVKEDFRKLDIQFKEAIAEEDETEFIKKCADFHFDFTKVHPFTDANGRTARILNSMMFATRNMMMPSLYATYIDKYHLYDRSNFAFYSGDYTIIENDFFSRLGHFYPIIRPIIERGENKSKKNNVVTVEDLVENHLSVTSAERVDVRETLGNETTKKGLEEVKNEKVVYGEDEPTQ